MFSLAFNYTLRRRLFLLRALVIDCGIGWFIFFTLLLCFSSCGDKRHTADEVLVINPKEADRSMLLSELVDSVYYIKLETSENCLMGQLREVVIKEKYIYAIDKQQEAIFVFDKKGRFISKLDNKGESPEEYTVMGPVFISENEDFIEVIDDSKRERSRMIKYSNISFEYLRERPVIAPVANSWRRKNDFMYFSTQQIENIVNDEVTNADLIVVKDNKDQRALFKKNIDSQGNTFSPNVESFTVNDKGDIYVSLMYSNTFYQLSGMEADPILTIDFEKYGMDNTVGQRSTQKQMEYLERGTEGLATFPVLNINNDDVMAFSYYFKENSTNQLNHYINFKKSNRYFHVHKIVNDLTDFPRNIYLSSYLWAIRYEVMHGDFLVEVVLPWHELQEKEMYFNGVGTVKAEDNPIILLMKPKKVFM
ncbi:hypothetical protein DN752_03835 [Echinicola strongylocentroti]|uniref:6-bladed beta-propeller n=1 Tax=Echinicola strongylocentroti TaxID=1795355 RepID=A0A2Z4IE52_9BACT|nr:6-bladed beta-propeller [Echinicola strongylocentroti]AWW29342.1 hypothetical protein DN752_03835 [Echinicola strongylocentroti]